MTPGTRQLFIYYRVDSADAERVIAAVRRMQRTLCGSRPGLHAAVLRRPDTQAHESTLMETYVLDAALAPRGIDAALQARIVALGEGLASERHVEVFDACA